MLQNKVISAKPAILVFWSPPSSDRVILHYEVQYRVNGTASWSMLSPDPTTTSANLPNLQLRTVYQVRVRAVSDLGNGAWSSEIEETTENGMYF